MELVTRYILGDALKAAIRVSGMQLDLASAVVTHRAMVWPNINAGLEAWNKASEAMKKFAQA
jgi:hypothetical protein